MSEVQEKPETAGDSDDARPEEKPQVRPALPERKLSLVDQGVFLNGLLDRCQMHNPERRGEYAAEATLTLTKEDMAGIEAIRRTIGLFAVYKADDYVRRRVAQKRDQKARKGGRS